MSQYSFVCGSANGKEVKYNKPELHWGFLRSVTTRKDLQAAVPHLQIKMDCEFLKMSNWIELTIYVM